MVGSEHANHPKVLVTRSLPEDLLTPLKDVADVDVYPEADQAIPRADLLARVAGVNGIVSMLTDQMDAPVFAAAGSSLQVVANMAVGYDNVDVVSAHDLGITVTNTPDVLTETTADLAFALMMATARRLSEAEHFLRSGNWKTWSPMTLTGLDVFGKTLGIVGLGRIGQAVARRARGFGMNIVYHNRSQNPSAERELGCRYLTLDDLLGQSDFVVSLVPGSRETKSLFGEREFARMKSTGVFVNVARGTVVDEAALVHALETRQIYAAGLDVYRQEPLPTGSPLLHLDNVVLLPHIGSASVDTRRKMAELAIRNCCLVLTGQAPLSPVD